MSKCYHNIWYGFSLVSMKNRHFWQKSRKTSDDPLPSERPQTQNSHLQGPIFTSIVQQILVVEAADKLKTIEKTLNFMLTDI